LSKRECDIVFEGKPMPWNVENNYKKKLPLNYATMLVLFKDFFGLDSLDSKLFEAGNQQCWTLFPYTRTKEGRINYL